MFHHVGEKLQVFAFIYMILYTFKSVCIQFHHIFSWNTLFILIYDLIFALLISLMIYGSGYIVKLYENKKV